jgi:hypothetical protein
LTFQSLLPGEEEEEEEANPDDVFKTQLSKLLSDVIRSRTSTSQDMQSDPTVDEVVR